MEIYLVHRQLFFYNGNMIDEKKVLVKKFSQETGITPVEYRRKNRVWDFQTEEGKEREDSQGGKRNTSM